MANIRIPDILTDLSHVGTAGLPAGGSRVISQELEICRHWGFRIEEEGGRVFLRFDDDQVVPYWIQRETPDLAWDGLRVNGFLSLDSTNKEALLQARMGAPSGTLIIAEEQTSGKGRGDRSWYSPAGSGLYFSLIVRPGQSSQYWPLLTQAAAVALAEALRELVDTKVIPHPLDVDIKWPNDVLICGKKCAGILLETTAGSGNNPAVVVGVGINVRGASVAEEMVDDAICIDEPARTAVPRRRILVVFLRHFQAEYRSFETGKHSEILDRWKSHSTMWDGARVWIEENAGRRRALTRGLNETGALMVETEDGSLETILAGDVRIRRP
ncbi:MAG: biotin--[acetyl-CoA-carboxylase] ligase [Acidobacteria bacterium]|nr:biotin--[acetyl-CoA-carboxylase] ligase [Acidobacteriota bacterium]